MNLIAVIDSVGAMAFCVALLLALQLDPGKIGRAPKLFFVSFLLIFAVVEISNVLEHGNVTAYFDLYEDYLEVLFIPLFLFYVFAAASKLEMDKLRRAENSLRESEEKYRTLVENIDLGVALVDRNFDIIMVNSRQATLFGRATGEFAGGKCFMTFRGGKDICPECPGLKAMKTKIPQAIRSEYIHADGRAFKVDLKIFPVFDNDGRAVGFIALMEDITEKLKTEEALQRMHKLESIGVLAGGIAHDFNNLLTGIIGSISLAKRHLDSESPVLNLLDCTEKSAKRAKGLTQQLLTFSSGGAPVMGIMFINDLIKDAAEFMLTGSTVKTRYDISEDLWAVEADSGQIGQVIQNLVKNADEAMPGGGIITITARNVILDAQELLPLQPGSYVVIAIGDSGPGIDPAHLDKIFDPYFTTKKTGSGLGLAISHSIVGRHGGWITVESEKSQGTRFHVYLPATDKQPVRAVASEHLSLAGSGRILFMDDDEILRDVMAGMLSHLGYESAFASDGEEAIEMFLRAREQDRPYDALIMDLTVPGGMGGKETIKRLLEIDPRIRAIASSGYANDPIMQEYRKHHFKAVLPKPFDIANLGRTLKSVLRGEAGPGEK